jgi:hypothetical protein
MLAFEVVDFSEPYNVILGRPCYVKFMAIPSYTYLKLKILRPTGIITMEAKARRVLNCEHSNIELPATVELKELYLSILPSLTNLVVLSMSSAFKAAKDAKVVQIDAIDPAKIA